MVLKDLRYADEGNLCDSLSDIMLYDVTVMEGPLLMYSRDLQPEVCRVSSVDYSVILFSVMRLHECVRCEFPM